MNIAVRRQELRDVLGLVRRKVVSVDMNRFSLGLVRHDVGEKRHELCRGMSYGGLAQHFTGFGVEGSV